MQLRWRWLSPPYSKLLVAGRRYSSSSSRSYGDAIAALNSLQSNFQTVEKLQKSGKLLNELSIPEMVEYCRRIGYEPSDFDRLRPIHIAGTKGKGSTSAFVSSILTQVGHLPNNDLPVKKVGLYTSPHLRSVRERIKINNEPISEAIFTKYFFDVWDRLETPDEPSQPLKKHLTELPTRPSYFRFLTLVAFHTYVSEGVDTAIIECGIGGEYDSTNIIRRPTVTGITSLGLDHTNILGDTIKSIAWHKGGIMKRGVPCWSSAQPLGAANTLQGRAKKKGVTLAFRPENPHFRDITLGLPGAFQKKNASLAVALARTHLRHIDPQLSERDPAIAFKEAIKLGLENVKFSGRGDIRQDHKAPLTWHIDCAHTAESLQLASNWFQSVIWSSKKKSPRILLFNQATREPGPLLKAIYETTIKRPFQHVIFCTNRTYKEQGTVSELNNIRTDTRDHGSLDLQHEMARIWGQMETSRLNEGEGSDSKPAQVQVLSSIEEAVLACRGIAKDLGTKGAQVFVTGSVHLVGGFLEVFETEIENGATATQ